MTSAEGRGVVGGEKVDAYRAGVHPVRHGQRRFRVCAEHQSAQTELGVVRQLHGLISAAAGVVVLQDADDRAENLLPGDPHVRGDVGEHGRFHEVPAFESASQ
ncbi:hypothetical protein D9M72_618040 [compost metagenome]